ncbi:MAG: MaoC family dehydratase, partial [Candidatus Dormibacteraceae bacterium]
MITIDRYHWEGDILPSSGARLELQYFEDLQLGGRWETRGRTISDADLTAFSGLSGDFNPLHVDEEHAGAGHFGGRVAHASLVSGLAIGLGSMDVPLCATVGLVGMSWKFHLPVKPGDTIRSRWRLVRKRAVANPRWGLAVWEVEVLDQRGGVAAQGEVARLIGRRSADTLDAVPSPR